MKSSARVIAAVGCGTFMATLDASIVNIALPTLNVYFKTSFSGTAWVATIYHLIITCTLLPLGAVSDQFGKKRVYQFGFFVFIVASIFCGLSQSLPYLIIARLIQGLGGAMLMANGPAIITACIPKENRGMSLGTLGMIVSLGLAVGPALGAPLVELWGWRSIFWINIPFGILGLILTQRYIEKDKNPYFRKSKPFDWRGSLLQGVALISFLTLFESSEGAEIRRIALGSLAVVSGFSFYRWNKKSENQILDLSILKDRTFTSSNFANFLNFIGYSAIVVLFPFYLEEILNLSTSTSGRYMTLIPLVVFIVAPISGRLSDRIGSKELSILGAFIGLATLIGASGIIGPGLTLDAPSWHLVLILTFVGLANGVFQPPNNNAIMSSAPIHKLGSASAFLATLRNLGIATGTSMATFLFDYKLEKTGNAVTALHFALAVASLGSVGAIIASFGKIKKDLIK